MPNNVRFPKSNPGLDDVNTRQNVSNIVHLKYKNHANVFNCRPYD